MDLKYGSQPRDAFVTNVGLITSNGPLGHDIMAAEWTMQISYDPGLILISVGPGKATRENISASRFFGVSIAAEKQNIVSSVSGATSGRNIDKVAQLQDMGYTFTKAQDHDLWLVDDAMLRCECSVIDEREYGDHIVFVGEASHIAFNESKSPLIYHKGKYVSVGPDVPKPSEEEKEKIRESAERFGR